MDQSYEDMIASIRANSHTIDSLLETLTQWKKEGVPGDTVVVMSKDAEGNGFSPLSRQQGVTAGMYAPDSTWSGDHFMDEAYRRSLPDADEYEPAPKESIPAAFLWPTN